MELRFEPARVQDAQVIFALCRELVTQYEDPGQVDIARALNWCRRKIETHIEEYTRVTQNGEVVGFYHFSPEGDGMELDDVYVLPPFRGRGIGSEILTKCCRETSKPITLCVFRNNTGAVALYERFGFQISEAVGTTRLLMRREAV